MKLNIVNWVLLAGMWYRILVAVAAGILASLSLAPFHYFPVLFVSFPVLVLLIDGVIASRAKPWWQVFVTGYCFGCGYFGAGLSWIGLGLLRGTLEHIPHLPVFVACLVIVLLPLSLAVFTGLGVFIAGLLWRPVPSRIFALALGLALSDYLRGTLLSSFPWNSFGYGLASNLVFMQPAALFGIYGMSWLAVLVGSAPVLLCTGDKRSMRTCLSIAGVFALLCIGSSLYLSVNVVDVVPRVRVKLVQPNIDRFVLGKDSLDSISRLFSMTFDNDDTREPGEGITHVVWPESVFPISKYNSSLLEVVKKRLPDGVRLITGGTRVVEQWPGANEKQIFNSVLVLNGDGNVESVYDKTRLVPFGEYLPLRRWFSWMGVDDFLFPLRDFSWGYDKQRLLPVYGIGHVVPSICYEIIFPDIFSHEERGNLIINVTSDTAFNMTIGPWQHLHQARLRAVERGLPLFRVANRGISAVFDGNGRILAASLPGKESVLSTKLPVALKRTPYVIFGNYAFFVLLLVSLVMVVCDRGSTVIRGYRSG